MRRGLTLIEVLAATVILAATAGAGSAVIQRARGAFGSAALTHEALHILAVYDRERIEAVDEPVGSPWEFVAGDDRVWRITTTSEPLPEDAQIDERFQALVWTIERVETRNARGAFETVFTRRTLTPAPPEDTTSPGGTP